MTYYRIAIHTLKNSEWYPMGYYDDTLYKSKEKAEKALQDLKNSLKKTKDVGKKDCHPNEIWVYCGDYYEVYRIEPWKRTRISYKIV